MRTAVFSIVSPNYRAYARVLMASVQRHHPDWDRFVLLVGGPPSGEESFTSIPLDVLPIPHPRQFCFRYTILELNTAVKPWMFAHLFARGYDRVVYLDPDIVVYSPLAELDALPADTFLTLTPHLTGFIGDEQDHPSERAILKAGAYNLGFLAVARQPSLDAFLGWWQEKLEFDCVSDVARGLFVDQKWIDLAPGLFPGVVILRHDGYNVAYWNLRQRTVSGSTVNGQPLRFFHFSGVDPAQPKLVSRYDTLRRADTGDAGKLVDDYVAALRAADHASLKKGRYAFGFFHDGTPLADAVRFAYRNSPELQAACGDDPFAHPEVFRARHDDLPAPRSQTAARVAWRSYMLLSRLRPLVLLFPKSMRTSMRQFLLGRRDPPPQEAPRTVSLPPGLNIAGYISRPTGMGESARMFRRACEAADLPSVLIDVDGNDPLVQQAVYRASLFHVNADMTLAVREKLAHVFEASAYNIGCWHWELESLPDDWVPSARPLSEIWAPSAFIQTSITRKVTIPVVHMPHGIEVTDVEACTPQELGVPAGHFTFLCLFDLTSVRRKNPLGAVEAFRRAFPNPDGVTLLVKASQSERHPDRWADVERQLRGIPGVHLTNAMLSRERVNGLTAACDAVVSLHRAEGFGLVPAEAMYLGKPVIATGWSGNMDFMNTVNSCPVGYEFFTLDESYGPRYAGQRWADADVDHAAHFMRRLFDDAEYRKRIGEEARRTMLTEFSPRAAGLRYRARLEFLGLI